MIQQPAFTIHGTKAPMEALPEADDYIVRIRIPADRKKPFRKLLSIMGISRAYLFPDLDNLAKEIAALEFHEY